MVFDLFVVDISSGFVLVMNNFSSILFYFYFN